MRIGHFRQIHCRQFRTQRLSPRPLSGPKASGRIATAWPMQAARSLPVPMSFLVPPAPRAANTAAASRVTDGIEVTTSFRNEDVLQAAREMEARGYSYVGHRCVGVQIISSFAPAGLTMSVLTGVSASDQQRKVSAMQQRGWALTERAPAGSFLTKLSFRYQGD